MGCQAEVYIGDNLTFSICTHDPDTGALTDADAAPSYRVYEDETGTAILTGTMAKLDDANTTGFYTEQIACTAANGFEHSKTYTIYVEATVDSDTGGICYGFRALTPGLEEWTYTSRTLTQSAASVAAAVEGDIINIQRGDTLSAALTDIGALTGYVSLDFTVKASKTDADTAAILLIRLNATGTDDGLLYLNGAAAATAANGSITIDDAASGDITIALAAAETDDLVPASNLYYDIQMITATAVTTLSEGRCNISGDVRRAIV